jgi:hypothetical protein
LTDAAPPLESIGIGPQVHAFVLQAAPQPLDEDVVDLLPTTPTRYHSSPAFSVVGVAMLPVVGSTRKISDVAQKFAGTASGRMPTSRGMLQTNKETPGSSGPAIGIGGTAPITSDGVSLVFRAVIQLPNTVTNGGVAVNWNSFHAGGDVPEPVGMVGQDTPPTVTGVVRGSRWRAN